MRTALVLLLLLSLGAIPGSILPQRDKDAAAVASYLAENPRIGPWLDRLGFFDVFVSPWFSAIYLLLFVSLVGCLVPRLRQHLADLFAAPRPPSVHFDRLPYHSDPRPDPRDPHTAASALATALRKQRWRTAVREADDGTLTVAAEKGYLKETGNLVFHLSLLALLVGIAFGSWYGWSGNRLIVADPEHGFCDTVQQYDQYDLGARVGPGDLPPFCLRLSDFHAEYTDDGTATAFAADIAYTSGAAATRADERPYELSVNHPLRVLGANVYLFGHGYAPVLRLTDRYGVVREDAWPFLPDDAMLTSHGVAKYLDVNTDPAGGSRDENAQLGFSGIYLPTLPEDGSADDPATRRSAFPGERDPALMLIAYSGDLGLGSGSPQSVYELSQRQIDNGKLVEKGRQMLRPGQVWTLPDGSTVEFVGTRQWITISVRHDPGQGIVLAGAVALLAGLMVSLSGRRRRIWARMVPAGAGESAGERAHGVSGEGTYGLSGEGAHGVSGESTRGLRREGSLISFGGQTRGGRRGFGVEFDRVVRLSGPSQDAQRSPVTADEGEP